MAAAASLGAIALSGYQTLQTMRGQADQTDAEVRALNTNAALADRQQADAIARGEDTAQRLKRDTSALEGAQRVGYASQGVDLASGSAADVLGDTAYLGEHDIVTARNNARREAFGYQVDAENSRTRAEYAKRAGKNARTSTLLTGLTQIGGLYRATR